MCSQLAEYQLSSTKPGLSHSLRFVSARIVTSPGGTELLFKLTGVHYMGTSDLDRAGELLSLVFPRGFETLVAGNK